MLLFVATVLINASIASELRERALLVSSSIAPKNESHIVGIEGYQHICTGTLLNADVVLTAAHCLNDFISLENIVVLAGVSNYRHGSDRHVYPVVAFSHAGFRPNRFSSINDIALVFLSRCVDMAGSRPYGKLENHPDRKGSNKCTPVETVGFGKHEQIPDRYYISDGELRVLGARQRIHSNEACSEAFINYYTKFRLNKKVLNETSSKRLKTSITSSHGCSGGDKMARDLGYTCKGDSGGPVFNVVTGNIVGVTSFTSEICGTLPNYFTLVQEYDTWIKSEIQSKKTLTCPDDFASLDDLFTYPVESSNTPRSLTDTENEPALTIAEVISYLTTMNNGTCYQTYLALNSQLSEPTPDKDNVHSRCNEYTECICDGNPFRLLDMAEIAQPVWNSNDLHKVMTVDQQIAISRLLLCNSEYETYYASLSEQAAIAFQYLDMLSTADTCDPITA